MIQPLYTVAYFIALAGAFTLSPFSKKLRTGLIGRLRLQSRLECFAKTRGTEALLWFHVASSGEFEQCLPVLDCIRSTRPLDRIVVTYFSPTASRAIELERARRAAAKRAVPWDFADYAPFDLPWSVNRFIKCLRPQLFVAIHREIWPQLLWSCSKYGLASYLIAFHPSQSFAKWGRYFKGLLTRFSGIACINESGCRALDTTLGIKSVALGDPRVDRVVARREMRKAEPPWAAFFHNQQVVIFASLWPQDVYNLSSCFEEIKADGSTCRALLVPHELDSRLVERLRNLLPGTRRWTHWLQSPDDNSHIVVDAVGVLAELYSIGSLVFVGGSFKGKVHNVLEPAAYGRPILTGPYVQNSSEALEMSQSGVGLFVGNTGTEVVRTFKSLIGSPTLLKQQGVAVRGYVVSKLGASERIATWLVKDLQT